MHTPQVITSGVDYVFLIVPVVVVLFGWIGAVYWADSHPSVRHVGRASDLAISGQAAAETTLAAGAADEHQAEAGERIATRQDTETPTEAGQSARSGDTETGPGQPG